MFNAYYQFWNILNPFYASQFPPCTNLLSSQYLTPEYHSIWHISELQGPKYKAYHETLTPLTYFNLQKINTHKTNTRVKPRNPENCPRIGNCSGARTSSLLSSPLQSYASEDEGGRMSSLPFQSPGTNIQSSPYLKNAMSKLLMK